MKIKIIIVSSVLIILVLALILYLLLTYNSKAQDISSILQIPIIEDQIINAESRTEGDSTKLTIYTEQSFSLEELPIFDLTQYEGSQLYDELINLINKSNMNINELKIKIKPLTYTIKKGVFGSVNVDSFIYIITENHKNTIIFAIIPNGVVLPLTYRP